MQFNDALKIGSKLDGYVKCTYAKLCNYDLGTVFSLQARYYTINKARKDVNAFFGEETLHWFSDTAARWGAQNADVLVDVGAETEGGGLLTLDLAVVQADGATAITKPNDYVPVTLTELAKKYTIKQLELSARMRAWAIYEHHKNEPKDSKGSYILTTTDWEKVKTKYLPWTWEACVARYKESGNLRDLEPKDGCFYTIEDVTVKRPGTLALIDKIEKENPIFYVKACAIDWVPTDIKEVMVTDKNGKLVKLSDLLAAAKSRLDTAKALLLTAGASNVIY